MATRRLPLELELRILDCAVPPRTFANLASRARILKRLALVHSAWTARAQSHLAEQVWLLCDDMHHVQKSLGSRRPKRLDIVFDWEDTNVVRLEPTLREDIPHVDEIAIRRTAGLHCDACDGRAMSRMDRVKPYPMPECPYFHDLPSTLRYLSIAHLRVQTEFWPSNFCHLDTLLLTDVDYSMDWDELLDKPHWSLRVFGMKDRCPEFRGSYLARLPPSLAHFAFVNKNNDDIASLAVDLIIPDNIKSLTVVTLSPSELGAKELKKTFRAITEACEGAAVQLNLIECEDITEVDAFDLEEWALAFQG